MFYQQISPFQQLHVLDMELLPVNVDMSNLSIAQQSIDKSTR